MVKKMTLGEYAKKMRKSRYEIIRMCLRGELECQEEIENGKKVTYILLKEETNDKKSENNGLLSIIKTRNSEVSRNLIELLESEKHDIFYSHGEYYIYFPLLGRAFRVLEENKSVSELRKL